MTFDLVVSGGDAVVDGRLQRLNIGVTNGRIAAVTAEALNGRSVVDATSLLVLPGAIDTHVHFREPGREDKEDFGTGTRAAAAGGITTVLEIQNNEPLTVDADAARAKLALVGPKACVNYGIYGSVGVQNLDRLAAMAEHVVAFKVFMTQSVGPLTVTDIADLARAFIAIKPTGRVFTLHAENDAITKFARQGLPDDASSHVRARPRLAEWIAVAEVIELCREYRTPVNLPHLSTARAVALVRAAKEDGLPVSAATCPQYLVFTADDVARGGNWLKINPSIKFAEDREALIEGLRTGVIDHVHSDHAPHTAAEKAQPYATAPSGLPGIQHQLPVLLDLAAAGRFTLPDVARIMCRAPAAAFGLSERGDIRVGNHADLTVVDPTRRHTATAAELLSKTGHSPFVGRPLTGVVTATIVAGRCVWRDGRIDDAVRGARVAATAGAARALPS